MSSLSVSDWQSVLQDIQEKKRHRLTGSEYKDLIQTIEDQPKHMDALQQARRLVAQFAQHEGPDAKPPFRDPSLNRVFLVEAQPATPPEGDPRLRERVIAGSTIFRSREYGHHSEASVLNERSEPGRLVHGKRLDVVHDNTGPIDKFNVYEVQTSTHIPYSTGMPGQVKEGDRKLHGNYTSFADAGKSIDETVGVMRHSQMIRERQAEHGIHWKEAPPAVPKAPRPA